jgi:hypothetical protein
LALKRWQRLLGKQEEEQQAEEPTAPEPIKVDIKGFTGLKWDKYDPASVKKAACHFCKAQIMESDIHCTGTMPDNQAGCCQLYACKVCSMKAGVIW